MINKPKVGLASGLVMPTISGCPNLPPMGGPQIGFYKRLNAPSSSRPLMSHTIITARTETLRELRAART